jgi:ClpP class serine protease
MMGKSALLAAIRAQPWAILPEYLDAIEAIALRAFEAAALDVVREDGHQARFAASLEAVAAVGTRLEGAAMSTVRDGRAVVPVLGPVFPRANMLNSSAEGTPLDALMRDFRVAEASSAVEQIVLLFDTPGGVVSGVSEAAAAIRGSAKPVVAFVTGQAASLGYWLASQASEIVMEPAAMVGSIGVVMSGSRQVQPGADGRQDYEVVSSGAPNKRPDMSTEEGRAVVQAMVDEAEAVFFADVAAGRKVSVATVRNDFGRGGMMVAKAAVAAGMADRIGTLESVLTTARRTGTVNMGGRRALALAETETRRRAASLEN